MGPGKGRATYNLFALQRIHTPVSLVVIKRTWTPRVRHAARRYKRDHKKAFRRFEKAVAKGVSEGDAMAVLCASEAKAVLDLLNRLGYGTGKNMARARDRLELELMVHERDEDASINFFRLYLAQKKGTPMDHVFTKRGRKRSQEEAEALRSEHIGELTQALNARTAAYSWLSRYYGRLELAKKYGEFTRVQFDESLDDQAKVAYLTLLFAQIAQRTGRTPDQVLDEFNEMVREAGLDVATAEIVVDEDDSDADGEG
ncbi:MAG: hypothetical protein GWN89_05440 [Thermoplasmata archaeon]|nr:hypothetical protein [Thermoplasmata archaeon]NIT76484.1 hypothetical protein [Thermoplasmata archaeon]NIU49713.1 hypothetical protein [Thermoplasmata archaeon]NIY02855.1 hypothetical protein [Thermoplasmata archaeon]